MRHFLFVLTLSTFALLPTSLQADSASPKSWSGSWVDGDGGTVFIERQQQILKVTGKDAISVYTSQCLINEAGNEAQCQGHGRQLTTGVLFLYQAQWSLDQASIKEKWTATFSQSSLTGELTFKRQH